MKRGPKPTSGASGGPNGRKTTKFANRIIGTIQVPRSRFRSIFLAKDAKGAKKHQRYPKPLGELGALCENPIMA